MQIADAGRIEARGKLALGKPGTARSRVTYVAEDTVFFEAGQVVELG